MEWLNYHHYVYFFLVAREGGLAQAGRLLRLSPQALSGQIRQLEAQLGGPLFTKVGRRLSLTEFGRAQYRIAEDVFALGQHALQIAKTGETHRAAPLTIGVAHGVPKLLVNELIAPLRRSNDRPRIDCREDRLDRLLASLSLHEVDVVIADMPVSHRGSGIRAFNHQIAESGISFFAAPHLAKVLKAKFPQSLQGAPFIMPSEHTSLGKQVRAWLQDARLRPNVVAEVEDSAMMKVFGRAGDGVFPSPTILESNVAEDFAVKRVGRAHGVVCRYFAITAERRIGHPALQKILGVAQRWV